MRALHLPRARFDAASVKSFSPEVALTFPGFPSKNRRHVLLSAEREGELLVGRDFISCSKSQRPRNRAFTSRPATNGRATRKYNCQTMI